MPSIRPAPGRARHCPTRCGAAASAALWIGIGLASGAAHCAPAIINAVDEKAALVFPEGQYGRPSFLQTIKMRFDMPGVVGELQNGWRCARSGNIVWSQKSAPALLPARVMMARFRAALEQAHYPVPVVSDSLFVEKKDAGSDPKVRNDKLRVGVLVKEIAANLCTKSSNTWTGEAYLKLFWQVFAPEQQKVIFEATTEGRYQTTDDSPIANEMFAIPGEAFSVAARNLLADPGYLKAVATPADPDLLAAAGSGKAAWASAGKISIEGARLTDEPLSKNITLLRSAVITVFGEVGSGSGFFVGRNGMLLTNQHVVGKSKFVKVRLATGRELIGEVQRVDAARDVALVKTEPAGVQPLPVRLTDAAIGEDVYALGSPLGDAFNTTLTKGIVSGVREIRNQSYLQSDVAILPGNSGGPLLDKSGQVIGITVMGLGAKGMAGMNFFVPVADALNKLDLQITIQ